MKLSQIHMLEAKNETAKQTIELLTAQNMQLEAYQKELVAKMQQLFQDNLAALHAKSEMCLQNQMLTKQLNEKSSVKEEQ